MVRVPLMGYNHRRAEGFGAKKRVMTAANSHDP